jgi:uncharacterized membrane protein (DUF106 family)
MIEIVVTAIAIAYVAFSVTAQRKLTNPKRTYEIQQVIKDKTKELNEMSKNKASQEQMAKKQKEITGLLSESMRSQMKPMFVILPVFFIMFYVVFPAIFPTNPNVSVLSMDFDYKTYFILVSFVLGFVLSMSLMIYDKVRLGGSKKQEGQAQEGQNA